jgi:BirA family biotin operon repressor/biotin-[acetyl-CoA-carboxylase] ligase
MSTTYDGIDAAALATRWGVPSVEAHSAIGSTNDRAHALAAQGAPAGTVVLADRQDAGRGRNGRAWVSAAGQGIWISLLERPRDPEAIAVLSVRVGLAVAAAVAPFADDVPQVKWPNDVLCGGRKLAGVLIEARWRDTLPEWVVLGVGCNVRPPDLPPPGAAGLRAGTTREAVLARLVPALRAAAAATGLLRDDERAAWEARDWGRGRRCLEPGPGIVEGIASDGALVVRQGDAVATFRTGSLVLA